MSERIRGSYDDALYKSTYTLPSMTHTSFDSHIVSAAVRVGPWDFLCVKKPPTTLAGFVIKDKTPVEVVETALDFFTNATKITKT